MNYDAIVIGGGVVGASAAYHLAKLGVKALLIDRHDEGRATDAGAGIIAPETSGTGIPVNWFPFSLETGAYYPLLIEALKDEQAGDTGYKMVGEIVVAADEDELPAYEQKRSVILERQRDYGLPTPDEFYDIDPADAKALFPALKTVLKAMYFRRGARVDGRMLAAALLKGGQSYGLTNQPDRADQLVLQNGRVTGAVANGVTYSADKVIIAGGAWSAAFGRQLGCIIPVEPSRGQIIHLRLNATDTSAWPIVEAFHGHYLVCWPDGRVVAGATREIGTGFLPQTTAAGVHEVLGEAMRVAPGLSVAAIGEIRVGLRPRTADNLPVLGGVPGVEGIYLTTGHGANGLQLGPLSGKLAAEWAAGYDSKIDISLFSVTRFPENQK